MGTKKPRIDWMPGAAAREALELAKQLYPNRSPQELIDQMVITGLGAAVAYELNAYQPPALMPRARQTWKLPADFVDRAAAAIKQKEGVPGNAGDDP